MNYDSILSRISPSVEEVSSLNKALGIVRDRLSFFASAHGFDVEVVAGGSTAKGTFLKGNFDVDMFVRFKQGGDLSDLLEQVVIDLASELNVIFERVHGSRDYFQFSFQGFFFEIVPVKFIDDIGQVENVTDMSPLHVFWVRDKLGSGLSGDIRLAKQFCKACGVYGAESYINGFSGHVLDILIIEYGGFDNFVRAVASWGERTVVDPEKQHVDVFKELNKSKLDSPLIVIDPIDPARNASAALSVEKYDALIASCKAFLVNPSEQFFEIKPFSILDLQKSQLDGELLFVVKVTSLEGKRDVVATKVLKVFEFLSRHLQLHGFTVLSSTWNYDEVSHLCFVVRDEVLSSHFEREGPPLKNSAAADRFRDVHKENVYERDGRLFVKVGREFLDPTRCIQHLLAQEFVSVRCKDVSLELFVK